MYKMLLLLVNIIFLQVKKSSVASQALIQKCGLKLIGDCPTRWSSTYMMISRLLELKVSVNEVSYATIYTALTLHLLC